VPDVLVIGSGGDGPRVCGLTLYIGLAMVVVHHCRLR
jgi:hypothetical protein